MLEAAHELRRDGGYGSRALWGVGVGAGSMDSLFFNTGVSFFGQVSGEEGGEEQ